MRYSSCLRVISGILLLSVPIIAAVPSGDLIVAADIDYYPFSYVQDGIPTGFDIEFFDLLAKKIDLAYTVSVHTWSEVHRKARNEEVDIVLGALYTPERDQYLEFTDPYNTFRFALVVHRDSRISSIEELNGTRMAYLQEDAVALAYLANNQISAEVVSFPLLSSALESVGNGETAFAIVPSSFMAQPLDESIAQNIRVLPQQSFVSTYRIGVTARNSSLIPTLNTEIEKLIHSAEYEELHRKWFPSTEVQNSSVLRFDENRVLTLVGRILAIILILGMVLFHWMQTKRPRSG